MFAAQFGHCVDLGCVRCDSQSCVLVVAEDYVCYACGIVSDYLPKKVAEELTNSYR